MRIRSYEVKTVITISPRTLWMMEDDDKVDKKENGK
jgi:hypothetical protein